MPCVNLWFGLTIKVTIKQRNFHKNISSWTLWEMDFSESLTLVVNAQSRKLKQLHYYGLIGMALKHRATNRKLGQYQLSPAYWVQFTAIKYPKVDDLCVLYGRLGVGQFCLKKCIVQHFETQSLSNYVVEHCIKIWRTIFLKEINGVFRYIFEFISLLCQMCSLTINQYKYHNISGN